MRGSGVIAALSLTAWIAGAQTCVNAVDSIDPTYGGKVRQLLKPDGHEHNLYYYRDVWNADETYMLGIQSGLQQDNWNVVLYDADGCFLKQLFPATRYDWRLVWDRHDPQVLYTWKGSDLYRFNVTTGQAGLLKSFAPLALKPAGPSVNQAGDRILAITSDDTFRSYRLPDMQAERTFTAAFPPNCATDWDKERYINCRNYVMTSCRSSDGATQAVLIYDDTGTLYHQFNGIGGGGHHDFSSDGKWAYFTLWGRDKPLDIHVVNLDGTNDRILLSLPVSQLGYVQNLHLAWPRNVTDWFVAGFFPNARNLPSKYAPYLDEIVQIRLDGRCRSLARTGTAYSAATPQSGGSEDFFWAQTLARPSPSGSRINFNSNRSGTIDQFVLYPEQPAPLIAPSGVVNAASYVPGPIAPGELVTIFGSAIGPATLMGARLNAAGRVDSLVAGVRVWFDGLAAPVVYVRADQLTAVAPYALAGKPATELQIEYLGFNSAPLTLPVANSAPGIFTADSSGRGWAAAINQDASLNSAATPAPPGSIVTLYATGEGQTDPPGADGKLASAPLPKPALAVSASVGGVPAEVTYAGAAPGEVAGVLQVNVRIPAALPVRGAAPVVLTIGNRSSQPGVMLAVQ